MYSINSVSDIPFAEFFDFIENMTLELCVFDKRRSSYLLSRNANIYSELP